MGRPTSRAWRGIRCGPRSVWFAEPPPWFRSSPGGCQEISRKESNMYGNESNRSFTVGLLCGAAIGAAVGLLLAPKSGAEMRTSLSGSATKLRKTFNDRYEQASGMVERVVEDGREALRRGREAFD